ncbi:MAG: phage regulatory protein/antirepressor Ant [Zoogloeaceae bacterium]|jgi:phage antirepressor YoqD-like protein|nr:phage regulatory protein/antirepressor Ant [Zoogloeaceae bacterium]
MSHLIPGAPAPQSSIVRTARVLRVEPIPPNPPFSSFRFSVHYEGGELWTDEKYQPGDRIEFRARPDGKPFHFRVPKEQSMNTPDLFTVANTAKSSGLIPVAGEPLTMSTREIAKICEKEHLHVMRDARNMLAELELPEAGYIQNWIHPQNGQTYQEFHFPKDLTLTLVTGYKLQWRKAVIDRWLKLEAQAASGSWAFQIPQTLSQALLLAGRLAQEKETACVALEKAAPKAAFADAVAEAGNAQSFAVVAKVLKTGEKRLYQWCRVKGILRQDNSPMQEHLETARFKVLEQVWEDRHGEKHLSPKTLITGKGLVWLQKLIAAEPDNAILFRKRA